MNRRLDQDVQEWLAAEQSGDDDRAERAMAHVMAHVGRSEPRPTFSAAVVRAAGFGSRSTRAWSPWLRIAVLVCLLAAGLAVAALPSVVGIVLPFVEGIVASALSSLWHVTARAASVAFAGWAVVADMSAVVRAAVGSAMGVVVLLANVLVATASLIGLKRLLGAREELAQC